jgi:DNA-binding sugar fermentation-stimulating protein
MSLLLTLPKLVPSTIIKRPSAIIKSPYVADIVISDIPYLAHSASLGCCGLADVGSNVWLQQLEGKKDKCSYRICLSEYTEKDKGSVCVGIYPKYAEDLVENAMKKNKLSILKNIKGYRREQVVKFNGFVDSRFDFSGIDSSGIPFLLEVKTVPLATYEDIRHSDRKKLKKINDYSEINFKNKLAYFPDGYRKKDDDPVSPRALKHIRELELIRKHTQVRTIMCYVVQRSDVDRFKLSIIDPEYRSAVLTARDSGVEIIVMQVDWRVIDGNGEAHFIRDDLPIL